MKSIECITKTHTKCSEALSSPFLRKVRNKAFNTQVK